MKTCFPPMGASLPDPVSIYVLDLHKWLPGREAGREVGKL